MVARRGVCVGCLVTHSWGNNVQVSCVQSLINFSLTHDTACQSLDGKFPFWLAILSLPLHYIGPHKQQPHSLCTSEFSRNNFHGSMNLVFHTYIVINFTMSRGTAPNPTIPTRFRRIPNIARQATLHCPRFATISDTHCGISHFTSESFAPASIKSSAQA